MEREIGGCVCFAVVDPNKGKKAKPGRGRFSVTANGEEKELVPANYVLDGECETKLTLLVIRGDSKVKGQS